MMNAPNRFGGGTGRTPSGKKMTTDEDEMTAMHLHLFGVIVIGILFALVTAASLPTQEGAGNACYWRSPAFSPECPNHPRHEEWKVQQ